MEYTIKRKGTKFFIGDLTKNLIGEIDYHFDEQQRIVITHTFVDPAHRGQGLANQLLDKVIAIAEKEKRSIVPVCSFAAKVLSHERYRHLVAPSEKALKG